MPKEKEMSAEDFKYEVQDAAYTLIRVGPIKKRLKKDAKFRKAVNVELKKRLEEKQAEVAAAKEAVQKT